MCLFQLTIYSFFFLLFRARAGSGNRRPQPIDAETQMEGTFEDWTDVREWLDADFINWVSTPSLYLFTYLLD